MEPKPTMTMGPVIFAYFCEGGLMGWFLRNVLTDDWWVDLRAAALLRCCGAWR